MKKLLIIFLVILFGCSENMSPENNSDDILLIFQYINSEGKAISGNDSLITPAMLDGFPGFIFERSDTSIFIKADRISNIDEIKSIVITINSMFSTEINGTTNIIYLNDKNTGEQVDSLLIDNSLKYKIEYNYNQGSVIVNSPNGNSCLLSQGMTFIDSTISIYSYSRHSYLTGELVNLIYQYTHYQKVTNYGFINRSKIKIIQ